MASKRELDKLLKQIDKVESDQRFASRHGYDAAAEKKRAEAKGLWDRHRKGLTN